MQVIKQGDITGFDDAEVIEVEEEQEDKTQSETLSQKYSNAIQNFTTSRK